MICTLSQKQNVDSEEELNKPQNGELIAELVQ